MSSICLPLLAVREGLGLLYFGVLFLYLTGVISVGVYFSRRQTSTDQYLLGRRSMSPIVVGISLIATLLFTITYLGAPTTVTLGRSRRTDRNFCGNSCG